jgi:YVTN family beta-propeller protein
VFSALSDSLLGRIELDGKPYGLCFDATDSKLYVACIQDDAVWVVDCATDTVTACIEVAASGRPSPLAYSAFGNRVYFVSGDSLGAIDCSVDTVTAWVAHKWYNPSPPQVFSALRLVSVTGEGEFITAFSDPPARLAVASTEQGSKPTVMRDFLRVPGPGQLYDLSGRNVLDLLPGPNDVGGLSPGIYFAREHGKTPTRKVIILR